MQGKREVKSYVKDESLIEKRREQDYRRGSPTLQREGIPPGDNREIAKAAGLEQRKIHCNERGRPLYTVCDSIYNEVQSRLSTLMDQEGTIDGLREAIDTYYHLIDDMSDEFVVMYQESE